MGPLGHRGAETTTERAPGDIWVSAARVAEALGVSRQAVAQRAQAGQLQARIQPRPGGGRQLAVALSSLPEELRARLVAGHQVSGVGCQAAATIGAVRVLTPEIVPTDDDTWNAARAADRDEATRRLAILGQADAWLRDHAPDGLGAAALLLEFVRAYNLIHGAEPSHRPLSRSTIYRWRALFRQRGRVGLLPGYVIGERDRSLRPFGDVAPEGENDEIRTRFNRAWLTQRQLSVALAREVVVGELTLSGSPLARAVPSAATFHRYVQTIPQAVVTAGREGWEAYRNRHEAHLERDYESIPVMDTWVSDHCEHDVWVRGANGKPFRPWITLWQDVRSRLWLGWTIHAGPCLDTVLSSLAAAMLRYGIPGSLYTDNGREYSAHALSGRSRRHRVHLDEARIRSLTEHLQVAWSFSLPNNPQSRGMIERDFGTMHDRFDRLWPTYCGRNPQERPEQLAAVLAAGTEIPTLEQFTAAFGRWVAEDMNVRPREGDGMAGRSAAEVFAAAEYVKRTATADELRLLFMRSAQPVTVQRNGLWAFDRWYRSDPLAMRQGERVTYRYSQDDISELYVYTLQDEYLCTVQRKELAGGTSADHRAMVLERQRQRRLVRAYLAGRDQERAAPDQLAAIIAARAESREPRAASDPERPRGVVRPVRTAFYEASKALQAESDARDPRAAAKRAADRAAAKMMERVRREAEKQVSGVRCQDGDAQGELLSRIYQRQKAGGS